eukprot:TRINITY_DN25165_c0_g1_i1.p1 TRINITY_DN25165_c0_g1~~TRINITY_DN25165_c0_g1_i1.p1  ORF type:complete len:612 (+),score=238.10 TRINITY_DN25165_c0_g1_i1:76-1911(+)
MFNRGAYGLIALVDVRGARASSSAARRQRRNLRFSRTYEVSHASRVDEGELGPKDVVHLLDSYVIGQADAKREVSVALRERWRRLQLPDEKSVEITPKNILVSGPSGCGKTEIIRRVSKIMKAPFVKVDASTFTRRGVVGANVQDMIVDLYDRAEELCKESFARDTKDVVRRAAEDILAEAMVQEIYTCHAQSQVPQPKTPDVPPSSRQFIPVQGTGGPQPPLPSATQMLSALGGALKGSGTSLVFVQEQDKRGAGAEGHGAGQGDDASAANNIETLLGKPLAELVAMGDKLEGFVKGKVQELGKEHNRTKLSYDVLRKASAGEGENDDEVVITLSAETRGGMDRPLQMLLGGQTEHVPKTGTVREYLRWLEEDVAEALSQFRFSGHRCPVKDAVEKWGIVCIDEIDKVVGRKADGNDRWMNTDVQQELLTLIEGTKVDLDSVRTQKRGGAVLMRMSPNTDKQVIDTTHILFVCAGAFTLCKPHDMLIELLGRLPVRVSIHSLTEDNLHQILTNTKYPMVQQQSDLFSTEGVELKWEDDAVREIARIAWNLNNETENTGARVLSSILRAVLSELSFRASDLKGQTVTITRELVVERTQKLFPEKRLNTYVL